MGGPPQLAKNLFGVQEHAGACMPFSESLWEELLRLWAALRVALAQVKAGHSASSSGPKHLGFLTIPIPSGLTLCPHNQGSRTSSEFNVLN